MANVGIDFNGEASNNIFENIIDEDLASLYPNIILTFNLEANALLGKLECESNPLISEMFGEIFATGDVVEIGHKFLELPTTDDILANLEEFLVAEE